MVKEKQEWIPNFTPNSSSKKIMGELFSDPQFREMTPDGLFEWLSGYRDRTGLKFIDVLQLRDRTTFDFNIALETLKPNYGKLATLCEGIIQDRGIIIGEF